MVNNSPIGYYVNKSIEASTQRGYLAAQKLFYDYLSSHQLLLGDVLKAAAESPLSPYSHYTNFISHLGSNTTLSISTIRNYICYGFKDSSYYFSIIINITLGTIPL